MVRPIDNPPNPWESTRVEWLGEPPPARTQVYEEQAGEVLSENDSPDLPFRWTFNPYRGCHHGCGYCYARNTHTWLGFGAGSDFERRLVVKTNAVEQLGRRLASPGWRGERIAFSGVTDCYQPLEASYELTRGALALCRDHRNPVAIVTKGALVERDLDLLAQLCEHTPTVVYLSIPFADQADAAALEPWASPIEARFAALAALSAAGVTTGVSLAPLLPGLNDHAIPELLTRAREAGARHAFANLLRLPGQVKQVFEQRLTEALPGRARKILSALDDSGAGRAGFGQRFVGQGPRWQATWAVFETHARRLGLADRGPDPGPWPGFRRERGQGTLFG